MTIGIIGAGALGQNLAKALANAGVAAKLADRNGPDSIAPLAASLGQTITAVTAQEAAAQDIVVLAIRWEQIDDALKSLPSLDGRIVIDPTNPVVRIDPNNPDDADPAKNPLAPYGIKTADIGNDHSSALVRARIPGARLVKAFNHFPVELLPQTQVSSGQRVAFYSGDDVAAKAEVRTLIETIGMFPVDLGSLDVGGPLASLPFGSLAGNSFAKL